MGKNYFVFFKDLVTQAKDGIMSATDKRKLDGIAENANNYTHPNVAGSKHIPAGGNAGKILRWSADGAAVWGDENDTTYTNATDTQAGLMSAADKKKLDGIADKATAVTVDAALSSTSTNPVQNKIINAEFEELKKFAGDGKNAVAAAITGMGVNTATDADFDTIAGNIQKIGGDTTISAGDVLSRKIAYAKGQYIIGSMPNQGAKTAALDCGDYYTIPAGYHNGSGRISANSLASQTGATAVASDILSGKIAYVNGNKVTGTISSKVAATYTPSTQNQEIAAGQYLSGKQTIKGDANLSAGNIKKGVTIFGVTGNLEANKLQVRLGKAILQQLTLQTFDISLREYQNGLSDRSYASWYSSSLFETIVGGYNYPKLPYYNSSSGIGISHTFILFETGECLHFYLERTGDNSYSRNYEWIDNQQPTTFNVHVFSNNNGDTLTRYGKKDNDTNVGTFSSYDIYLVTSVRTNFYILTL